MVVIICGKYGNNRCRTENVIEWTRFSNSRSNDLEDIGQGQRSSHATHLLMLVIICTKYGKNPSRTVDATERTQFSRQRPNDLEDIGQGQRSLYTIITLVRQKKARFDRKMPGSTEKCPPQHASVDIAIIKHTPPPPPVRNIFFQFYSDI